MNEQITEIRSDGTIKDCGVCGNPTPGMAHSCTDYLKSKLTEIHAQHSALDCEGIKTVKALFKIDFDKYCGHAANCMRRRLVLREPGLITSGECDCGHEEAKKRWR